MNDYSEIFSLYSCCFPQFTADYSHFCSYLEIDKAQMLTRRENDVLAAFSLVRDDSILLLCTHPSFRSRGLGAQLLQESEDCIRRAGFAKVKLGLHKNYLFQGVPMEDNTYKFFMKRGYRAGWATVNMTMELSDFDGNDPRIRPCPENVSFRFSLAQEKDALLAAVNEVSANWVRYYENPTEQQPFVAVADNKILGFCLVGHGEARFFNDCGSVGCVGVVPSAREQGVGLAMVAKATQQLKEDGYKSAYIGYTDLEDWYGKLGYVSFMTLWMGEKDL